ncbi:MAG TPA: DUF4160 domain-containing protein [Rhizobiaceae bacterium]|nr:DUF4160 domain-containing protein [Rhizobiaceae bacterium]
MPTLCRFGSVSIRIYADDHRPPHFHIVAPDFQVLVRISDLSIMAGNVAANRIAEPLAWAKVRREFLALKWAELNERD